MNKVVKNPLDLEIRPFNLQRELGVGKAFLGGENQHRLIPEGTMSISLDQLKGLMADSRSKGK